MGFDCTQKFDEQVQVHEDVSACFYITSKLKIKRREIQFWQLPTVNWFR